MFMSNTQSRGGFNAPVLLTGRDDPAWDPFDMGDDRLDKLEEDVRRLKSLIKIVLLGGLDA